jgi:Tfp pilus assembly protein PilO
MRPFLLPIILLGAGAGLFVLYTDPSYQATKALAMEAASYEQALNTSQELRKIRDQLIARRNTLPEAELKKLERMLPDNVDNIRLIIDVNGIATRHGLSLKDVNLGDISDSVDAADPRAAGSSGDKVGSVTLDFTVSATYDQFLAFLQDIEHSLRLLDIEHLEFAVADTGKDSYSFTVRTYWLH